MKLGRDLSLTAYRVFGLLTPTQRLRLRPIYRRDFIGRGLPPMLIPQLALNLREERRRLGSGLSWLLRPQRRHGEKFFEVIDENDLLWGRGISPEQAQARALSLWMTITQKIPDEVWGHSFGYGFVRNCSPLQKVFR